MPRKIFVDTSYVLALFNTADEFHTQARELKNLTAPPHNIITIESTFAGKIKSDKFVFLKSVEGESQE